MVNRMTGVFRSEAKSDAKDARVIAEAIRIRSDLTELSTSEDLVVLLRRHPASSRPPRNRWRCSADASSAPMSVVDGLERQCREQHCP
ncbi:transposase [Saccharopolyspora sp. 5N102]|uniref:IS110 family transposase n=1 Tax=Saccharopolyspora sp. 5N102 TaxID=3375155 RepID=UPI0037B93F4C